MDYSAIEQQVLYEFQLKFRQAKERGIEPRLLEIGIIAATVLELHCNLSVGDFQHPMSMFYGMKIKVLKSRANAFTIDVLP